MKDFKGISHLFEESHCKSLQHRFHAQGATPKHHAIKRGLHAELNQRGYKQWWAEVDKAWVVCLVEAGIIDRELGAEVLNGLEQTLEDSSGISGEDRLLKVFQGNSDKASVVNYGRTLQEPMSRMKMRAKMLEIIEDILKLQDTVHTVADEHIDTIMPAYTHLNHGQPMTLAHYLISFYDNLERGLEQVELSYKYINKNSGGCGSTSGTIWPIDRQLLTQLLGFDDVVESTYDCEASQDHSLAALFALSNIMVTLTRIANDLQTWTMSELDMMRMDPGWCGASSYMPQKCDSGTNFENVRIMATDAISQMVNCVMQCRAEPHGDVLGMAQLPERAYQGMVHARRATMLMEELLRKMKPQKEQMLENVRSGYSCATELQAYLVRHCNYGNRRAHSVVATMIRDARTLGLKAYECTGDMLDEAADFLELQQPGLSTETVRKMLDPEHFVATHDGIGGTAPTEVMRMLSARKSRLCESFSRHEQRVNTISDGNARLQKKISDILKSDEATLVAETI